MVGPIPSCRSRLELQWVVFQGNLHAGRGAWRGLSSEISMQAGLHGKNLGKPLSAARFPYPSFATLTTELCSNTPKTPKGVGGFIDRY